MSRSVCARRNGAKSWQHVYPTLRLDDHWLNCTERFRSLKKKKITLIYNLAVRTFSFISGEVTRPILIPSHLLEVLGKSLSEEEHAHVMKDKPLEDGG
jgi:hypothetical protein